MVTTNVTLCGRELENPIIPASGTFGYGYEFAELYDINCLGTFSFKGTTLHPRTGNAQPRIAEAPGGMLNAVGLQNPGVDAVIAEELPVSLINTVLGMRIDLRSKKPLLANKTGGMSGPAIFPLAVRMVWQVYEAVRIPIIGMGGVRTAEDVLELMLAGATAVEVGAANLVDPFACRDLVNDLPRVMEQYHIQNLNDIIGGAHHG